MDMSEDNRSVFRSLTDAMARGIDRLTEPARDPWIDAIMNVAQLAVQVMAATHAGAVGARGDFRIEGAEEEQVRREFEAEEAALKADYHAKRARLVADFGPRFVEARDGDDARSAADHLPALVGGGL
jgi:hypothetical protein